MKTFVIFFALWVSFLFAYPQTENLDSLKSIVESKLPDSSKLQAYVQLVQQLAKERDSVAVERYIADGEKLAARLKDERSLIRVRLGRGFINSFLNHKADAQSIFTQLIEESRQLEDSLFLAEVYEYIGETLLGEYQYSEALRYFEAALPLCEVLDSHMALRVLLNIDGCNWYLRDYSKSLKYAKIGTALADSLGETEMEARFRNSIGIIYFTNGRYDESQKVFVENLVDFDNVGSLKGLSLTTNNLANIYFNRGDFDSTKYYLNQSLKYSRQGNLNYWIGRASMVLGWTYVQLDSLDSADYYLTVAKEKFTQVKNYSDVVIADLEAGKLMVDKGQVLPAIDYLQNGLRSAETYSDTINIAKIYSVLSSVYNILEETEKALQYSEMSLQLYETIDSPYNVASANVIMSEISKKLENYQEAMLYANKAIGIYSQKADSCLLTQPYLLLGASNLSLKKYDSAIHYLSKAKTQAYRCKSFSEVSMTFLNLGKVHEVTNNYEDAIIAYKQAIEFATKVGNKEVLKDAGFGLYTLYSNSGKYKDALEAFELYHHNYDSLFNEKNTRLLTQKELSYAYDKEKQEQALLLEQERAEQGQKILQQKWLIYSFIGALVFMGLLILAFYRNYRNKQKANILLSKQNDAIDKQRQKLQELDRSKSRFFANISHELRTPLTLIAGPLENLLDKQENVVDTVKMVLRNTSKLKELVNDILDLSKLESFKLKVNSQPVDIRAFAGRVSSNYDSMARKLGLDYSIKIDADMPECIMLDIARVEKIINNLLFNAIKYTKAGGNVSLQVNTDDDTVVFKVVDSGQGIPPEDLPHIFERYYQSKQPDAPIQGGTGIGLALAHELAVLMSGELDVVSTVGQGSTFICKLPLEVAGNAEFNTENQLVSAEQEAESVLLKDLPVTADQETADYKILYVEDSTDMQYYVQELLSGTYQVVLANDGKQALHLLEKDHFDLVITDAMMPEMDGYTMVEYMKASDQLRIIPVIMLTALNFEDSRLKALSIGVDDYLSKPFSASELIARVQNLIVRYEARKSWVGEENTQVATNESDLEGSEKETVEIYKSDMEWLKKVEAIIWKEVESQDLNISNLSDQFHISRRQFHRRIKKLTGLSPKQYQQDIALQKARRLLEDGTYSNVTAVGYAIGIGNVSRFSQMFFQRFGKKPGDYFKLGMEV